MLSAFTNSLKIPELRQKIFFTLALLFIARVGANIPLPGVDPTPCFSGSCLQTNVYDNMYVLDYLPEKVADPNLHLTLCTNLPLPLT